MRTVTIDSGAWRADEVRRFDLAIRKKAREDERFRQLLSDDERNLPTYERPLKEMKKPRLSFADLMERLKEYSKILIP